MLIFEKSRAGRGTSILPACDVKEILPGEKDIRCRPLHLAELTEGELSRHYSELARNPTESTTGFILSGPAP